MRAHSIRLVMSVSLTLSALAIFSTSALAAGTPVLSQGGSLPRGSADQDSITTYAAAGSSEDWKGAPDPADIHLTALTGLGVIDNKVGFSLIGAVSKKVLAQGFAPDINNSVSIELEAGPLFVAGGTAFIYSAHMRWDFVQNSQWTFFGIGGLAGNVTGDSLGNRFELFPRFGVGALVRLNPNVVLRGEISHELTVVGVTFPF